MKDACNPTIRARLEAEAAADLERAVACAKAFAPLAGLPQPAAVAPGCPERGDSPPGGVKYPPPAQIAAWEVSLTELERRPHDRMDFDEVKLRLQLGPLTAFGEAWMRPGEKVDLEWLTGALAECLSANGWRVVDWRVEAQTLGLPVPGATPAGTHTPGCSPAAPSISERRGAVGQQPGGVTVVSTPEPVPSAPFLSGTEAQTPPGGTDAAGRECRACGGRGWTIYEPGTPRPCPECNPDERPLTPAPFGDKGRWL